jgi:hypothetical protein
MPSTLCDDCQASGLPIMPLRYTPVPRLVKPALPVWVSGQRVIDTVLGDDLHYALRTLRAGYVYLFYSKNQWGANQWECYMVTADGVIVKQPDALMAAPRPAASLSCSSQGHSNIRLHHLVIERPDKCGSTWIAFSPHKWSEQTLNEYKANSALRNDRMQTLHPAEMAKGAKHGHGTPALAAALEQVLEYSPSFRPTDLPYDTRAGTFSKEDGWFDAAQLAQMSTRYPWHLRQGQAETAVQAMLARGKRPDGGQNTPHLLALWDAIGIAHELNGFRNDPAGRLERYGQERSLEISASHSLSGLKLALDKRITDGWDAVAANTARTPDVQENSIRMQAVLRYAKGEPALLGQPLCELDEKFKAGQITEPSYKAQRSQVILQNSNNPAAMESEYAKIDQHRRELAQARNANKKGDMARAWAKYQERLNKDSLDKFNALWALLRSQADTIIDRRTSALVKWLESSLFIDTLEDFHATSADDGVLFEDAIGDAIFGMGSSASGAAKIDEWVKQAKAGVKSNLIWRTVASNHHEGIAEVDAALQVAYGAPVPLTAQAWDRVASQVKWNKVFDLGKKSLTAYNTQAKAVNDAAAGIKPLDSLRGLDKVFLTVGGAWLRPFTWTLDTANELALRTLLMVRSGADPLAAKALGAWDAVNSGGERETLLRRLKNQDYYLSAAAKAQYEAHAQKWAALRSNAEVPDAKRQNYNAARDARLALVVAVFEAFNLHKASAQAAKEPGSEKVQAQLTAAKLATAAAAVDVLTNMVKGLAAAGDKAVSYQALKFGGGALSVVASGYGAALDWRDRGNAIEAGDYRMATLYGIRSIFQGTSSALTALTSLSYCSPLIESFGRKFGERLAGQALSWAAKRLLLARAALVFASLEVSIFLLAVSIVIWYFEDDALQKWCDRCAFGLKCKSLTDAYRSADMQLYKFGEALKEAA